MERNEGLHDKRRPADVEIEDWLVVSNWTDSKSLCIDVTIIDPLGDSRSEALRSDGVGAAAAQYENHKCERYRDIEREFSPFVLEAHDGIGTIGS